MSQVTTGLRSMLSIPLVYEAFQKFMGATANRKRFVERYVTPFDVECVLDIGCGPAGLLEFMPSVNYYGFDISASYINDAKQKYGDRGVFINKHFERKDLDDLPRFDLVILSGVLHHVTDENAVELLRLVYDSLKPGGRLVTMDGVLVDGQNPIARYLILKDRGQNIKTEEGYVELVSRVFDCVDTTIQHNIWLPYTLCYLQCTR